MIEKKNFLKKDKDGNTLYFPFGCWAFGYVLLDKKSVQKIHDLENYRELILSYKPPIIIPIIIFSFLVDIVIGFIFPEYYVVNLTVFLSGGLYCFVCIVYLWKIKNTLKKSKLLSKEEKKVFCANN